MNLRRTNRVLGEMVEALKEARQFKIKGKAINLAVIYGPYSGGIRGGDEVAEYSISLYSGARKNVSYDDLEPVHVRTYRDRGTAYRFLRKLESMGVKTDTAD